MVPTDEEIIFAYKNGDAEAFKSLIDRYTNPLYNFTARLASQNDAPDIVAETFIKVWKKINRFDKQKASFKTWIFTIARNTAIDFLRRRKNILFSDINLPAQAGKDNNKNDNSFSENIPDEQMLPDIALQKLQDKELLDNTLNKLSSNYREILVLHYQEEMTFAEIGKILNKPLNTVKSQYRRAITQMRKILEE